MEAKSLTQETLYLHKLLPSSRRPFIHYNLAIIPLIAQHLNHRKVLPSSHDNDDENEDDDVVDDLGDDYDDEND